MQRILIPTIALLVLWLALSGRTETFLFVLGGLSCLFTAWLALKLRTIEPSGRSLAFTWRLVRYIPWLLKEIVMSSISVSKRALSRDMRIQPTVVTVEASQKTPLGVAAFANSITLTPGTLSIDARPGSIEVHALSQAFADDLLSGEMNRRVRALEGED